MFDSWRLPKSLRDIGPSGAPIPIPLDLLFSETRRNKKTHKYQYINFFKMSKFQAMNSNYNSNGIQQEEPSEGIVSDDARNQMDCLARASIWMTYKTRRVSRS